MPGGEGNGKKNRLSSGFAREGLDEFLIRVDARAAALERGTRFRPLQYLRNRFCHVFHVGRLQSRQSLSEYWINGEAPEERDYSGNKCVIRAEHYRRTNNDRASKRFPDCQLALAAFANVER